MEKLKPEVGDAVLIRKKTGFHSSSFSKEYGEKRATINKVTKTQFTTDNGMRFLWSKHRGYPTWHIQGYGDFALYHCEFVEE